MMPICPRPRILISSQGFWCLICRSVCMLSSFSPVRLFRDSMDCSPPGSSVHGILPARILEWVAMPSSRGFSWPWDQTHVSRGSCTAGRSFTDESPEAICRSRRRQNQPFTIIHIITTVSTTNILSSCHQCRHFQRTQVLMESVEVQLFLRSFFLFHCSSLTLRLRKTGLIDNLSAKCKRTPFW